MEIKTKHRILGVLVVLGLVIILFPFFQSAKDVSTDVAAVKAPPFPDQSVQVGANANSNNSTNTNSQSIPVVNSSQQPVDNGIRQTPDDVISVVKPSVVNETITNGASTNPTNTAVNATESKAEELITSNTENDNVAHEQLTNDIEKSDVSETKLTTTNEAQDQAVTEDGKEVASTNPVTNKKALATKSVPTMKPAVHITNKRNHSVKAKIAAVKSGAIDEDGLFKLKNRVWVIQIGSFKNKTNALRLVNTLRASGYRAFIQQYAANTRVFVGPETKQNSARDLAGQIENEMHLKGVVISYKPLTL